MGHCPEGWDPEYWYDMRNYLEEMTPEERKESRSHFKSLDPEVTPDFTFAHKCSNRVVDFLETYGDKEDFLLVVSYDEPHGPSITPSEYYERFANYKFPVPRNVKDTLENKPEHQKVWAGAAQNKNRENIKIQNPNLFACNSFVDSEIGRVLDAIDEFAPETLVIYTSDHGTMLKSHCLDGKGPAMYDEITNIPFIIKWKGHAPKGIKSKALLSHIDLTPSILDYFGVNSPPLLEGESKLNLFQSEAALLEPTKEENQLLTNSEVFMEFGRYEIDHDGFGGFQPIRAVRNKRFKLVINLLSSDELYDLKEDPGEMKNLIGSETHAEIRNELHDRLLKWMNKTRDPFRGYYWERRPWRKDAADATWDYTGMTRQRVEDEIYEPKQLDYNTGMPIKKPTRKK